MPTPRDSMTVPLCARTFAALALEADWQAAELRRPDHLPSTLPKMPTFLVKHGSGAVATVVVQSDDAYRDGSRPLAAGVQGWVDALGLPLVRVCPGRLLAAVAELDQIAGAR